MARPIACRLTAALPSAIATLAVRGHEVHRIAANIIGCRQDESFWQINRIRLLAWPITDATFEQVVICRVSNDAVEIHCHGGVAVSAAILNSLANAGCEIVDGSDWVAADPHSLEEKIDRLCNTALIQARSERAAGVLLDQQNGALLSALLRLQALVDARDWIQAAKLIANIKKWNSLGLHLTRPWRVVLAGPPNVGKSSLINSLAGQAISIVHAEAGTTRDWIETETMLDGWHVVLTDTAGVRDTDNPIEKEGVERARQQIATADLVILVADSTIGWTIQHDEILNALNRRHSNNNLLVAWNKCDLQPESKFGPPDKLPVARCSAQQSLDELMAAIVDQLVPQTPPTGEAVLFEPVMQDLLAEIDRVLSTEIDSEAESELKLLLRQLLG